MSNKKTIYVDHSSTTRVRPEVVQAMSVVLQEDFGNPSSIHRFGRKAKEHLNCSRSAIASIINASEEQIFFTSGGTESDNTVILGLAKYFDESRIKNKDKHIISTKIEHPAVKEPLEYLETKGWNVSWLGVDKEGFINLEELKSSILPRTFLVSVIHANNEIGTIQDLKKISAICKENNVLFHSDAVQSYGKIPINMQELEIDFMSFSAHKIYGPKGVGALYIKGTGNFAPILIGGGQQKGVRPGTENLASIVGFAAASKLLKNEMLDNAKRLRNLQINLMEGLLNTEDIILTGVSIDKVRENIPGEKYLHRIPGHVSACVKDVEGENLILQLDLAGIAASSGSACSSGTLEPSHVLVALGVREDYVRGSLRLTLGRENTEEDINYITNSLKATIGNLSKKAIRAL